MGLIPLPASGSVYVDTQVVIYTVERNLTYLPLLLPLWQAVQRGQLQVITSELTLMETLVVPIRLGDRTLVSDYERFLAAPGVILTPLTRPILYAAATRRAAVPKLKTPDAVHCATAELNDCALLATNDRGVRSAARTQTVLLDELIP